MHWSWKKVGGTTAAMVVYVRDQRTGAPCSAADCSLTYYAGEAPPRFGTGLAIQVSATLPDQWTTVRRNVLDDARTALGLYDDENGGVPDSVNLSGYGPIAIDGTALFVDHMAYGSLADIASVDPTGEVAAADHPTTVGDTTRVWDYTADDAEGQRHYFNRDGLLTTIRDIDGYTVNLDWTVSAPTTGPGSYRLDKVRAPLDGTTSGGVTFEREFELSRGTDGSLATLRVDEDLGSTSDDRSARAAIFELETDPSPDLIKLSPARHIVGSGASGTFCGSAPSGCVEFSYGDTTNHRLAFVADPRWTGATSGSADLRFEVTRNGTEPQKILDRSHGTGGSSLLYVLSYNDPRLGSALYDRAWYFDAASGGRAIAVDLAPGGTLLTGYAPRDCQGHGCTSFESTWPPTADQGDFKTVRNEFDGLARVNTVRTYRCPASSSATAGCTGTTELISLARQARRAGAKVDNYIDPLSADEIAWRQSSDQWFASVKDSAGGNPDLYRTDYRYDGRHRLVTTRDPAGLTTSTYPEVVKATPNVTNRWRLDETAGTTVDDSVGTADGTRNGATLNQPGLLVRTNPNLAFDFDGVNDRVTAPASLSQSAYSIEAWIRPDTTGSSRTVAGDYLGAAGGAMIWLVGGTYVLVHTSTSTNYLYSGAKVQVGRMDHVAATWSGKDLRLYVNGELVGTKPMTTAPGVGATNFEIGMAANSAAYPFDGRIDEVALYNRAMEPDEVRAHYAAGVATAARTTRLLRDRAGRVTETVDQFLINGAFETGLAGWATTGSPTTSAAAQRTGSPGGAGASLPSGSSVSQIANIAPGQTVRLQYYQSGGGFLQVTVAEWTGTAWANLLNQTFSSSSWVGHAWDIVAPIDSDGRLKVTFASTFGTAYLDDAIVLTRWTSTTYATAAGPNLGLPASIETLLPGCADCTQPTVKATLGYTAGVSSPGLYPAMFPTSSIANDVATVSDPTTQDVTTTTGYDAWGRAISTTDPDGVTSTTTFAANASDVASTADDPDNGAAVTSYTYDAVGNRLTVTTPLGRTTTTTYDGLNHALTATAPDGTVARTDFNNSGQPTQAWANYVNGTTADGDGTDDLLTVTSYDRFGRVVLTRADCAATAGVPSCTAGLDARIETDYDLQGAVVKQTVYALEDGGSPRATESRFETYDPTVGPYASEGKLTRLQPTGTLLAIAPGSAAPTCPDGGVDCNTVSTLDPNGRVVTTIDAYGVVTRYDLDLDGRIVRTVANDTPGTDHGTDKDENVETVTRYDLLGRTTRTTMVLSPDLTDRWTRQQYDPLGRVNEAFTGSGSGTLVDQTSVRTRHTAGGRVERSSSTEAAGTPDANRAWTRTEYDADGRAVRTLENAETGGLARRYLDHFEAETATGWSSAASGHFTTSAAAAGPAFDPQASTIPAATGRHRLRVTTSSGGSNSGLWRDFSGRTFESDTGWLYRLRAKLWAPSGQSITVLLGVDAAGGSQASTAVTGTGAWQTVTLDWDPAADVSSNVHAAFRKDAAGSVDFALDDVMLYAVVSGTANDLDIATDTVYDADGRTVASVSPPGDADGDRPLVTRTAYDGADRVVAISTNAIEPYAATLKGSTGAAGYWPLDEPAGSTLDDRLSGTDLTLAGASTTRVAGGIDEARTALRFDGPNGYASRLSTPVSATDNFALEAWFRYDAVPTGSQVIAYNGTATTGWGIGFTNGKLAGLYGSTWLDSGQVPSAGSWHHAVLTRSAGTAKVYLDGTAYTPTNSASTPATPGASFAIGRQDATPGYYFKGDVDEVAIYSAALTAPTVSAHWAAGRQTSVVDALTTRKIYDRLGRAVDETDQLNVRTRYGYDRLGALTSVIRNHLDGTPSGELGTDDVITTYGRNVVGELIGYCSGKNLWDASQIPATCNPTDTANGWAWRYAYDALGRMIRQTPPDNQTVTDLAGLEWSYNPSGRLDTVCEDIAAGICDGTNPKRTTYTYDKLGRIKTETAIKGASTITTTTTYRLDGQPSSVTEGSSSVAITYVAETGQPDQVSMGGSVATDYAWNPDGTLQGRNDGAAGTPSVTFGYDWAKRQTSIDPPDADYGAGTVTLAYRLDGLLKSQTWPNGETATLVYDTARRPTGVTLTGSRSLSRSYDRTGRVTADDRYLGASIAVPAGDGTLAYSYDPLGRIFETKLDGVTNATYTYDRGSNRRTKTEGGETFTYAHDRTDAIKTQQIGGGMADQFIYDSAGNVTTERTKAGVTRTYTWDAADRLTKIDDPTGNDADLTYDPLDRVRTRTVGADVQTFTYEGTTDDLWRQAGATTSTGLLDLTGNRVGSKTGTTASWLVFDLLGSVAAAEATGSTTISDALRTDAYGQTIGLYPAGGSTLPVRFRGLVDLAPTADPDVAGAGSDPLYVMGARTYSPHTGTFTALDTYQGTAVDPATLHRYLYAHANPTTLIDPTGHKACEFDPCEDHPDIVPTYGSPPPAPGPEPEPDDDGDGGGGAGGEFGQPGGTTATNKTKTAGGDPPLTYRGIAISKDGVPIDLSDMYKLGELCFSPYEEDPVACQLYEAGLPYVPGTDSTADIGALSCFAPVASIPCDLGEIRDAAERGDIPGVIVALVLAVPITRPLKWLEGGAEVVTGLKRAPSCSFTPETLVATPDGRVPISSIEVGDMVLAWDESSGDVVARGVTAVLPHPDDEIARVTMEGSAITTTPDHPFFTLEAGWLEARALPGAHVKTPSGSQLVSSVEVSARDGLLWDLTVAGAHTFFVGEAELLVHNCNFGNSIANGHAWEEHAKTRFADRGAFEDAIERAIHNADEAGIPVQKRPVPGSMAYWDANQGMIVITTPGTVDGGTAFFGSYEEFLKLIGKLGKQ